MHYLKTSLLLSLLFSNAFGLEGLNSSSSHALSSLAPEGHWAIQIEQKNRRATMLYGNGKRETAIGEPYSDINLNGEIFPSLALFGAEATLGKTQADIALDFDYTTVTLGYGVTKDLTVGVIVPYRKKTTTVNFSLSEGNIGVNPTFNGNQTVSATNLPYLPTSVAGITPLTTPQLQTLLTNEFGYKPLESITKSGFTDPTVGFLYNAYSTDTDSLILGAGYNIPLAKKDDPDNLMATNIGDGNPTVRLRLEYFKELKQQFDIAGKFEYGVELADKITKRVPKKGEFLAPKSTTERLNREIGDYRIYNVEVGKTWNNYRVALAWHRSEKDADHYHSSKGTEVAHLAENTQAYSSQYEGSLSWSGIEAWDKGTFPLPLVVTLNYRDTYEGKNALKWKEVYLTLTSFF